MVVGDSDLLGQVIALGRASRIVGCSVRQPWEETNDDGGSLVALGSLLLAIRDQRNGVDWPSLVPALSMRHHFTPEKFHGFRPSCQPFSPGYHCSQAPEIGSSDADKCECQNHWEQSVIVLKSITISQVKYLIRIYPINRDATNHA